jgi:hypothetical protein
MTDEEERKILSGTQQLSYNEIILYPNTDIIISVV